MKKKRILIITIAALVKDIEEDDLEIIRAGMDKMINNAEVHLGLEETNK